MITDHNPEISKKEVASRLNETPSVFYKAIQYEEKLHPEIQRLVDEGAVPYSTSLLFTRIENLEKQLRTFIRANTANMDNGKIRKMINNIISQEELGFGLWSKEEFEEMSKKGAEENFKLTFNREAYQAITYLYFVSKSIQTEELNEYVPMTDAVARDMTKLIFSTMQFLHFLSEKYPNNFEYLQYLVAKELKNSSEYLNPKRLLSTMVRGLDQFVLEEKDANLSQLSLNS